MEIEILLAPVNPAAPCGDNLEYHADFIAMEQACQGRAEQQFGATLIPAEPADWDRVEALANGVLMRSKDLRAMVALTRAWTELQGLSGYARGLQLITQSLQTYWPSLFPPLEGEDEEGARARLNALAAIGDSSMLTIRVRQSPFLYSATEDLSLRDACALLDGSKTDLPGYPGGRARLAGELAHIRHPNVAVLLKISDSLQRFRLLLAERLGEAALPVMTQLLNTVNTIIQACSGREQVAVPLALPGPDVMPVHPATVERLTADDQHGRHVAIQSRHDALLMLEKVKMYFTDYEPGHPAPLMIERLQQIIGLDFMAIVRELAPDGASQLENLFGRRGR